MNVHVLRRRPLLKAKMQIKYLTAGEGGIVIDGEHVEWRPLCDEHFAPLLNHAPKEVVQLREFLLEDSNDWTGVDYEIPVYQVGWPGGDKLRVEGAKAAIAAIRKFYPFKDYEQPNELLELSCSEDRIKPPIPPTSGPQGFKEYQLRLAR